MQPFLLDPTDPPRPEDATGVVVIEEVRAGGRRLFPKGHRLNPDDLSSLAAVDHPIRAVRLDPSEIHEDEAGSRLAVAVAGQGVTVRRPIQSRVNLVAAAKGLLRVDATAVAAMNRLSGIAVFTLTDRVPVLPGKIVAGTKIIPVAIPGEVLREAERIAAQRPVVQVKPFRPLRIGVVATEGLEDKARDRFQEALRKKIAWYGGEIVGFLDIPDEPAPVAAAIERFAGEGVDLILTGGGNTMDPGDAALQALAAADGEVVKVGAPAHPGSMFWLAYRGDTPIFNVASCSMYSRSTVADLVLPWIMAGERVGLDDMAALGYGGLLDRDMGYRFPPYDAETSDEPGES